MGLTSASVAANAAFNIRGTTVTFTPGNMPSDWVDGDSINIRSNGGDLGYLNILGGSIVNSSGATIWEGGVLVSASTWNIAGFLTLGQPNSQNTTGDGTLTIADGGVVFVGREVRLGDYSGDGRGSHGTLNIGAAVGSAAAAPGTFNAGLITFGSSGNYSAGSGKIIFNHNDYSGSYTFGARFVDTVSVTYRGAIEVYAGATTLTGIGSNIGKVEVNGGTLAFGQSGAFTANTAYITKNGGTTRIGAISQLDAGTFTQESYATLIVALGSSPAVTANTVNLGGSLAISGFSGTGAPTHASQIPTAEHTVIHSNWGNITGDFTSFGLEGSVDYITPTGRVDGQDYKVRLALSWLAGQAAGHGTFTLADVSDTFNVDNVSLGDQGGGFVSGWNGATLTKNGAGTLILSSANGYNGGSVINGGILRATNAGALGSGAVSNNSGTLELAFAGNLANPLSGGGTLSKTGAGAVTLTGGGSAGTVNVGGGTLAFSQSGTFSVGGNYTTQNGAATTIGVNSKLTTGGAFTQQGGSSLNVTFGSNLPVITANTAVLGGSLTVNGFSAGSAPSSASGIPGAQYTIISTNSGITGSFSSVNLGGTSPVNYLVLTSGVVGNNYNVGYGLAWKAGPTNGSHGTFTLAAGNTFNVDVVLGDETAHAGWNGNSLTKNGDGTLILSYANNNTYSGGTVINGGRLIAAANGALGNASGGVAIGTSGTLELAFAGTLANVLSGGGRLEKTDSGTVVTITGGGSVGAVNVIGGTLALALAQPGGGVFTASSYETQNLATTTIDGNSQLKVNGGGTTAFTQHGGSALNVTLDLYQPVIDVTGSASLDGTLKITGFNMPGTMPVSANALTLTHFKVISTTEGINGNFSSVDFGGQASTIDYLTLAGFSDALNYYVGFGLSWLVGGAGSHGDFTVDGQTFEVDVALGNQAGPFASGWDGKSLTKKGAGTLILSKENTYTGATTINAGTLRTDIANAFAASSAVTVNAGATLDLNGFSQTANDLSGAGSISLGSGTATLTANNTTNATAFSGNLSGSGSLVKTGTGSLTLSGANTYNGDTTITGGTLIATHGGAMGSGAISNDAALELAFASDSVLANQVNGSGALIKTGLGTASLTANGGSAGSVVVREGTLNLAFPPVTFPPTGSIFAVAGDYETQDFAATRIGGTSKLTVEGDFTQNNNAALEVELGSYKPVIEVVGQAHLGGTLSIVGFNPASGELTASATDLTSTYFTLISTTGGITGDFDRPVNFGGLASTTDYLTLAGHVSADNLTYSVGFGLIWLSGAADDSHGTFTVDINEFNADVVLSDRTDGLFPLTGWDGTTLTKKGVGILVLSGGEGAGGPGAPRIANSYSGATTIEAGTLALDGVADVIGNSSEMIIHSGATLELKGDWGQTVNDLQGDAGSVIDLLGTAELTANNSAGNDTEFAGDIHGTGSLVKDGGDILTLSGSDSSYSGGTTITAGRLIATNSKALGTGVITNDAALELAFDNDGEMVNPFSGTGTLDKTGTGIATLTGGGTAGVVTVIDGTLAFDHVGVFTADGYTTTTGAETSIGGDAQLMVTSGGTFTQSVGSTLNVELGSNEPIVTAPLATLAGDLVITGFSGMTSVAKASMLTGTLFNVIHTTGSPANGITGTFDTVRFSGGISSADYLTLTGEKSQDGNDYNVEFGLSWHAAATDSHGVFTLDGVAHTFEVDVALVDQAGHGGWDGATLTKAGEGTLVLSGDTVTGTGNSYSGATTVSGGTLQAGAVYAFSAASAHTVTAGGRLDLAGHDQRIDSLDNGGVVALHDGDGLLSRRLGRSLPVPGTVLTVGNYVGNGGVLVFNTHLGNEHSATDKLVIGGSATGTSRVIVNNIGGPGARTYGDGILLIEAFGGASSADADFTLGNRVAAGAYEYELQRGTANGDNWYLSTGIGPDEENGIPNYRVEVPLMASITAVASDYGFAMLGTLHERVGGMAAAPLTPTVQEEMVRIGNGRQDVVRVPVSRITESQWFPRSAWGRVIGDRGFQRNHNFERRGADYDYTFAGIQTGLDVFAHEQADGSLDKAGVYVAYGHADTNVKGAYAGRAGTVKMDAWSVGAYWTHYAVQGWYSDAVVQGTWYATDARSVSGQRLKPDGFGALASLEGGYAFDLGYGLTLEPQAQLAYQHVSFDDSADSYGRFSLGDSDSLRGRLGLRLAKVWSVMDGGKPRLISTWVRSNVWHEFMGGQSLTVSALNGDNPLTLNSSLGGTWGEIGAGISGEVSDSTSLFATGGYNRSLDNWGRETWNGRVGVNVRW